MLEGDLADFTLAEILQLLSFTRKSGRLELDGDAATGRIDLAEGGIRDASSDTARLGLARRLLGLGLLDADVVLDLLRGRDQLPTDRQFAQELVARGELDEPTIRDVLREQAVDGVFDLLRWSRGSFRFRAGQVAADQLQLVCSIDEVVGEADTRLTTWSHIEDRTGKGDGMVTIARPVADGEPVTLDAEAWGVVAFVDGRRTIDELVRLTGRGQFHTRRVLADLAERGVVAIRTAGAVGAVEQLLSAHQTLADVEASLGGYDIDVDLSDASSELPPPPPSSEEIDYRTGIGTDMGTDMGTAFTVSRSMSGSSSPDEAAHPTAVDAEHDADQEQATGQDAGQDAGQDNEQDASNERRARAERLQTDPAIDEAFVGRLIDGVKGL